MDLNIIIKIILKNYNLNKNFITPYMMNLYKKKYNLYSIQYMIIYININTYQHLVEINYLYNLSIPKFINFEDMIIN